MTNLFDMKSVELQRDRSAASYFSNTELPALVEKELVERLEILTLAPREVLLLGAVTASTLEALCVKYAQAHVTVLDTPGMLSVLAAKMPESLESRVSLKPVRHWNFEDLRAPFDLVFSNFYLPLGDDLNAVFGQLHQVIRADGCVHFSCLGPDTFSELYAAWAKADSEDVYHTLVPPDMHDIGDVLVHAGFREPVMDRENFTLTYSSRHALLRDLRNHGVGNGFADRRKGLTGRLRWGRFEEALAANPATGRWSLTVEVVVGQAWRGDGMSQQRRPDGAVGITLEALAHKLREEQGGEG